MHAALACMLALLEVTIIISLPGDVSYKSYNFGGGAIKYCSPQFQSHLIRYHHKASSIVLVFVQVTLITIKCVYRKCNYKD